MHKVRCLLFALLASTFSCSLALGGGGTSAKSDSLKAEDDGKTLSVTIGGKPFAELRYKGYPKPIVYPITGPGGVTMVRHYPMKKGVEGEADDHPHQQSLWYTHGDVNGVSFWHIGSNAGTIVCTKAEKIHSKSAAAAPGIGMRLANEWRDSKGKVLCTDEQTITFVGLPNGDRAIDYSVTIKATHGDVTFGDTKEGTAGIRTHPKLRIDKGAKAVNSAGQEGRSVWGKRAAWVDYSAEIDGKTVGVAIFDHPSNPRHPTWWHARHYGLVAANPFGIHDFERKGRGTGDMKIEKGQSVTFKYRYLFHQGDSDAAKVSQQYKVWAK
jgi:hypothetical protein